MAQAAAARQNGFKGFIGVLASQTSLSRSRSPFESFGVLAAAPAESFASLRAAARGAASVAGFTVAEARSRLKEFIGGQLVPDSLNGLVSYLGSKLLRLEERTYGNGRPANYLVDEVSRGAVPAAQVDSRLSRRGLMHVFGMTVKSEVVARQERLKSDPRYAAAMKMRADLLPYIRGAAGGPAFEDWNDLRFMLPVALKGREYTVQGGKGYVGEVCAHASDSPAENIALLRKLRAEGRKIIVPAATPEDARAGRLVPGMPILLKDTAAPAGFIDPTFGHAFLAKTYGQDLPGLFRAMSGAAKATVGGVPVDGKIVNIAQYRAGDFKKRFAKAQPAQEAPDTGAFGGLSAEVDPAAIVIRAELAMNGRESLSVWNIRTNEEVPMDVRVLKAGTYPKEDAAGVPLGHLNVDDQGGLMHLDAEKRPHNSYGAAYQPAPGSDRAPRWALDGQWMSSKEYRTRIAPPASAPVTAPAFEPAAEETAPASAPAFRR